MAGVAAGVYFIVGKKEIKAPEVPANQSLPVDASAEQSALSPNEESLENKETDGDAEHSANHLPTDFGKLSDFTLTNQNGQEFAMASQKGKVLVMNFFFTKCQGPCPIMNKKMEALQEKFAQDTNVQLVSITVDPANDTAEILKTYAATFKANPDKWSFLTGNEETIKDIMGKQLKLAVDDMQTHSTSFVLIDKEANIKGFYDSSSEDELSELENEVRQLASSAS